MPSATFSAAVPTHGYVTSTLAIPTTPAAAAAYGRDIDRDGRVDNALGHFFEALAQQNLDFQSATDSAVQSGQLLMLDSLRTPSWKKTKKATWQVFFANATATPNFSGGGTFTVNPDAPRSLRLRATVRRHHVQTAAGTIPVEFAFGGVMRLSLRKAEIFATCSSTRCTNGRINGVITKQDVDTELIPELAVQLSALVARDCPGAGPDTCVGGSVGQTLQSIFDGNNDLVISKDELSGSALIQAVFAPDIDLNHDGQKDGLSAGFGFGAVRAKLVR